MKEGRLKRFAWASLGTIPLAFLVVVLEKVLGLDGWGLLAVAAPFGLAYEFAVLPWVVEGLPPWKAYRRQR